jgi:hypothetical protein
VRSYIIEEINSSDMTVLVESISQKAYKSPVEGLFWFILPEHLLSGKQKEHLDECGPYYLALEAGKNWLKLELLVRCEEKIRCDCICYASPQQREFMINFLDQLIRNQDVRV